MRKTVDVTITPENCPSIDGRDIGKTYRITEMPAWQAEEWANRAVFTLLPRLSREVPTEVAEELREDSGMSGVARIGLLLGGIQFPEMQELMRQMMGCVQIVTHPDVPPRALGLGASDGYGVDVEEVETIRFLRQEAVRLHAGFTLAAVMFQLVAVASSMSPLATP